MTDHVKTLEQAKDRPELNEGGTIMAEVGGAIRAVLEENERLRKEWDRLKDEARVLRSDRDAVTFERNKAEKDLDRLKVALDTIEGGHDFSDVLYRATTAEARIAALKKVNCMHCFTESGDGYCIHYSPLV